MENRYLIGTAGALILIVSASLSLNIVGGSDPEPCVLNSSGFEGAPIVLENFTRDENSIDLSFRNEGLNSVFVRNVTVSGENYSSKDVEKTLGLSDNLSVSFPVSDSDCSGFEGLVYYDISRTGIENRSLNGSFSGGFSLR